MRLRSGVARCRAGWRAAAALTALLCAHAMAGAEMKTERGEQRLADVSATGCPDGYRSRTVLKDFVLGRSWIVQVDCRHPERPNIAALAMTRQPELQTINAISGEEHAPAPVWTPIATAVRVEPPVVRAGNKVRLWRRDGVASIDLAGEALGSGTLGASVRVRLAEGGRVLRGTVREAGSVELEMAAGVGFREGAQ